MSEWKTIKLGELYDFKNGVNFNKNQKGDKGILTIDVLNMYSDNHYVDLDNLYRVDKNFSDSYFLKKGDILFVRSSVKREGVGWVSLFLGASEPVVFCGFIIRARPIKSKMVDSDFLIYLLRSRKYREIIINRSKQSTITNISQDNLFDITIDLPPIEEQKRIVEILDKAFEGIAQAEANTRRNLINARELFDSYLNSALIGFVLQETPQILADITELIIDCEHKTAPTQEMGYPSIRTPNIGKGYLTLDNVYRVSEETYQEWTRRAKPQANDLILAREAPAGNVGIVPEGEKVCLGQRTVLIRPKKTINSQYLAFYLLHPEMQKQLLSKSSGATVQHVNMKDIRSLKISYFPSMEVQQKLAEALQSIQSRSKQLETIYQRKLEAIAELKQSILEKAFTGQLSQ